MPNYIEIEHRKAVKAALYELLESLGYSSAASALYAAPGFLTIKREGPHDDTIDLLENALDDPQVGVIIIDDVADLKETLRSLYSPSITTQGYA